MNQQDECIEHGSFIGRGRTLRSRNRPEEGLERLRSAAPMPGAGRLRTDRLLLREWREADLEPFARLNADPEVMAHFPAPLSRAESDAQATRIRASFEDSNFRLWAVEVPGVTPFAGFVGLAVPRFEA